MAITKDEAGQTFIVWLSKQKQRDDPVGDLAVDLLRDPHRPRSIKTREGLLFYLTMKHDVDECVTDAAKRAWAEFIV